MANQIAQDKQRINLVISKSLVSQLDGIAARDGKTRSAVIVEALGAYVSGKPGTDSASGAKLDAVMLKLDAIASAQGELKAQQLAQEPAHSRAAAGFAGPRGHRRRRAGLHTRAQARHRARHVGRPGRPEEEGPFRENLRLGGCRHG